MSPTFTTPAGIALHYVVDGDASGRPLVLVHGTSAQLIGWHDGFVAALVRAGFRVIRFDNRDVGLSEQTGAPDQLEAHYDLADMADDVVAVLDELGVARAHVAGMSMGGYIAQLVAIRHPRRVASLGLLSTSPSSEPEFLVGDHGDGSPETALPALQDRDAYIAEFVSDQRWLQSPGFPFDSREAAELGAHSFDRMYRPDGVLRQWNALVRGPLERRELLRAVTAPAVIIHGRGDQSLHWHAALVLAELLPQAEVHIFEEMGHDVPRELWPEFAAALARTALRAERPTDA
ncbi:alpha/beta hydrolase [Galbitalea sp. SE-J8]|uniref:alpha/beta fold hydrolase n=1 Tax=Galbitalea sp. SE-J8 TaxID=3054952 RepID=UPI00259CE55F|nr:alpha/beta hydrolase [Galbitalea sp. SE-J8]MDM4763896.1 alpha/beta hydrolase [Galbitalea sp. SE-J8]